MKTTKEEQEKRIQEFNKDLKIYLGFHERIKNSGNIDEREKILDSPEYREINKKFSLGPTYIIWKEDYEDPDYRLAFGKHPSECDLLRKCYEEGYYGAKVELYLWGRPEVKRCVALAYDYGDYYYVIEELDKPGEYLYETMVSPVNIVKDAEIN